MKHIQDFVIPIKIKLILTDIYTVIGIYSIICAIYFTVVPTIIRVFMPVITIILGLFPFIVTGRVLRFYDLPFFILDYENIVYLIIALYILYKPKNKVTYIIKHICTILSIIIVTAILMILYADKLSLTTINCTIFFASLIVVKEIRLIYNKNAYH